MDIIQTCERFYKKHALTRMAERNVDFDDIKNTITEPKVICEYPDDSPLPSCLILGYDKRGKPLHLVWAYDEGSQAVHLITVYRPDPEKWTTDFTERCDT